MTVNQLVQKLKMIDIDKSKSILDLNIVDNKGNTINSFMITQNGYIKLISQDNDYLLNVIVNGDKNETNTIT